MGRSTGGEVVRICVAIAAIAAGNSRSAPGGDMRGGESAAGRPLAALRPAGCAAFPFTDSPLADPMLAELAGATGRRFSALDAGAFRVIAQGPPERAREVVQRTAGPVRSALLAQFLEKEPARGIRLVLFSDDETTGRATLERVLGLGFP